MQMQSTFTIPNGSVSGWTPTIQLQPVVQPAQGVHATQITPVVQPTQTQVMVVQPSNLVQYKVRMNQAGWSNQQLSTAQMTMACQTWNAVKKANTDSDWYRHQQEDVKLHQQYQLLHSQYQTALVQIQTLTQQQTELDKKLKIDHWKYQELNNKYVIDMQSAQNRYNALRSMHNETCIQLQNEQGKCNSLRIELRESIENLRIEQQKYKVLSAIHAETKKTLHSAWQKRDKAINVNVREKKSEIDESQYEPVDSIFSRQRPVKNMANKALSEPVAARIHGSPSNAIDAIQTAGADSPSERNNHLVVPPGFERRE